MAFPPWFMLAFLVFWMVVVGVAYVMGTSPVFGLVGVIVAATNILLRNWVQRSS